MKNSKKIVSLLLAFVLVISSMTIASAATTNASKAKVLHDLGLFKGVSATEYVPDLESETDAAQAIVLIGRALQWQVNEQATVTFTDVPSWAVPYVDYAVKADITNGVSATEFGVNIISGQRMVAWFLRALGYDMTDSWEKTALLATQASLTIPAGSLRDDVVGVIYEAMTTTPVDGDQTLIQTIVGSDATKMAVAQNAGLIPEEYLILSAKMIGTKSVELKFNNTVDTDKTTVQIKKNAAIYSTTATWNDAKNTVVLTSSINLPAATYVANVNMDGEALTKEFVVSAPVADSIEITSSYVDDQTEDAQIAFVVKNQYGENMKVKSSSSASDKFVVVAYNVTQKASATVDVNTNDTYFEMNTLASPDAFKTGDDIRLTVTYKGLTTQKNITVKTVGVFDNFSFGDIEFIDSKDTSLDESDESVKLNYTLVEEYGEIVDLNATSAVATLPASIQGIQFISSDNSVISGIRIIDDSDGVGEIHLTIAGAGDATITGIVAASGTIATKKIKVLASASPETVSITPPTNVVAGGDKAFDLRLTVLDQYGSKLTTVSGITFSYTFDVDDDDVTLTKSDSDNVPKLTVDLTNATVTSSEGTSKLKISAKNSSNEVIGSLTIDVEPNATVTDVVSTSFSKVFEYNGSVGASLTLTDDDIVAKDQYGREITGDIEVSSSNPSVMTASGKTLTAVGVGTAMIEVSVGSTSMDVSVSVVDSGDIDSYSMPSISKIYAVSPVNAAYQKTITIEGVSNDKTVVLIDNVPDIVTSDDESKATVAGNIVTGIDAGKTTISVWMAGKKVDSETITVSKEKPYAVSVTFEENEINNGGDLYTIMLVKDQYDVELKPTLYFSEQSKDYTITDKKFINGPTGYVEITVVTTNGLSVTKSIKVN